MNTTALEEWISLCKQYNIVSVILPDFRVSQIIVIFGKTIDDQTIFVEDEESIKLGTKKAVKWLKQKIKTIDN